MVEKRNSINTIRFLGAIQVIWGHMVLHLNIPDLGGEVSLHRIVNMILGFFPGVPVFFFLSGFLIWKSVNKYDGVKRYFWKRFSRIYPELWIAVLLEILSIIVWYHKKINAVTLVLFAFTQGTVLQFWTPDVLRDYGCGTPNGSLWTITVFVQFYILIWVLRKFLQNKGYLFWVVAEVFLIGIGFLNPIIEERVPSILYKLYCQTVIPYLWIFGLGLATSAYWNIISLFLKKWWFLFIAGYVVYCMCGRDFYSGNYPVIKVIITSFGALALAFAFPKANIKIDISYEMYILHMIIVNILITIGIMGYQGFFIGIANLFIVSVVMHIVNSYIKQRWETYRNG